MRYLFCDVETTGLKPEKSKIFEISGIITEDTNELERFTLHMCPEGADIDLSCPSIFNMEMEDYKLMLESFPPQKEVFNVLVDILLRNIDLKKEKYILVGYNFLSFDEKFLRNLFAEMGKENLYMKLFWWPPIDVASLLMEMVKEKRNMFPNFKQKTLAKIFKIPFKENLKHDSLEDVLITKALYQNIILGEKYDNDEKRSS